MKLVFIPKIAVIICTLMPAAAYSQGFCGLPMSPTTPDETVLASRGPMATNADPNVVVQKALMIFRATRSYRASEVNRKRSGESNGETSWDYVYPNRMSWGYRPEGVWIPMVLVIGDKTYSQDENTKKWKPQIVCSMASDFFAFGPEGLDRSVNAAMKDGRPMRMVGTDIVNGKSAIKYEFNKKVGKDIANFTLFIGKADNVLYQVREDLGTTVIEVTFFDLNSDIKIELPS